MAIGKVGIFVVWFSEGCSRFPTLVVLTGWRPPRERILTAQPHIRVIERKVILQPARAQPFNEETYSLLEHNCNHYAEKLAKFLLN